MHRRDEPDDHALGRSRGGLTTKVHLACDSQGRPLAFLLSPGQRHNSAPDPSSNGSACPAWDLGGRAAGLTT
jgi:hypothetical protein